MCTSCLAHRDNRRGARSVTGAYGRDPRTPQERLPELAYQRKGQLTVSFQRAICLIRRTAFARHFPDDRRHRRRLGGSAPLVLATKSVPASLQIACEPGPHRDNEGVAVRLRVRLPLRP